MIEKIDLKKIIMIQTKKKNETDDNFSKPRFVNSQLDNNEGNENMKQLETKGDLFLEKFKKLEDSSKGITKVEKRSDDEDEKDKENYNYHKKDSNKRRYYKSYNNNYDNYGYEDYYDRGDDKYFNQALGQEQKEENEVEVKQPKKEKKKIEKKEKKEKKSPEKIEGVIVEGNKTIVKGSGAKNLKELFG